MKFIHSIIGVLLFVSYFAEAQEKISVQEFKKKLETEINFNKSFGKDQFLEFYKANKKEIWEKDGDRALWKSIAPFLKAYNDKTVIETVLKDTAMSDNSQTLMFGWSPYVTSTPNSKIFYVLDLIFYVEGADGISKYYSSVKSDLTTKLKNLPDYNNSPTYYSNLTGFVFSLPDVQSTKDKLILSEIVMDYAEFMFDEFVSKPELSSVTVSITGMKEFLLNCYFYEEKNEVKDPTEEVKNSESWPHKTDSFNVRKYFEFLKSDSQKRELSEEEKKMMLRIRAMIEKLQK